MSPTETIIEKIQKLLALAADSGATPAEAETAAEMASRLMFQHSINEAQVRSHQVKSGDTSHLARAYVEFTKSAAWERDLMSWLSYINDTYFMPGHKYSKLGPWSCEVIGHKDNVDVTVLMFKWLRSELGRQASAAYQRNPYESNGMKMDPFRFHVSFKRGAVSAVATRLTTAKRDREKEARESGQSTALVLVGEVKDDALVLFYPHMKSWIESKRNPNPIVETETETKPVKTRKIRMKKPKTINVSGAAYEAGRVVGQMVRLSGSKELDK